MGKELCYIRPNWFIKKNLVILQYENKDRTLW